MNKVQIAKYNSFIKSDDFLDDNAATVAVRVQIPPLATTLRGIIDSIGTAMGLAEQDNTGYTADKLVKITEMKRLMMKVARAATAYYRSTNNLNKLAISDFKKGEMENLNDARQLNYAQKLYNETLPDAANLIGADAADLAALQASITLVADVLEDPKRAIEISKRHNDSIVGLLKEGDKTRNDIDIYMQTFIDENPGLYTEWKLSMSIDDAPTHSNPDYTTPPISCTGGGTITNIDYSPLGQILGSTNIAFTLSENAGQGIIVSFGMDEMSLSPQQHPLSGGSSNRLSAASLGYNLDDGTIFLNIRNDSPLPESVTVDFYLAD